MPIVSTKEILDRAFADRYGVAAFNILDDLTIDAVSPPQEERAPVILQTSVKTVRAYGRDRLISVFRAMAQDTTVPVAVHLDHCPYRDVITECLDAGWNSVLFDAHELDVADNLAQTIEVVAEAGEHGAAVEGEIEGIEGRRTTSAPTRHPNCRAWNRRRLHPQDRCRRLRSRDRQRARPVQGGSEARPRAGDRPRRGHERPHGPARRNGPVGRPVPRPHRPRLRQGQHLHGDQGGLHARRASSTSRRPRRRTSGTRPRSSPTSAPPSSRPPASTSRSSAARVRPGDLLLIPAPRFDRRIVDGRDNGVAPRVDAPAIIQRRTRSPGRVIRSRGAGPDDPGMALTQPGSAAGGAVDAPRRSEPAIPQPADPDWHARRSPPRSRPRRSRSARLLAGWTAPPARAVCTTRARPTVRHARSTGLARQRGHSGSRHTNGLAADTGRRPVRPSGSSSRRTDPTADPLVVTRGAESPARCPLRRSAVDNSCRSGPESSVTRAAAGAASRSLGPRAAVR